MFISIFKDSLLQVTSSFKLNEFFCKCPDFVKTSHLLDFRLITAVQAVRDYYQMPVYITSSYRTLFCNAKSGGAHNSYHLTGRALDFSCPNINSRIKDDISAKGKLYSSLRSIGINGFGFSDSFIHFDVRTAGSIIDPVFSLGYDIWYYK